MFWVGTALDPTESGRELLMLVMKKKNEIASFHSQKRASTNVHPCAGANIGLYGLYFAARGCFVDFVEALPLNAQHIRFSIDLNGELPRAPAWLLVRLSSPVVCLSCTSGFSDMTRLHNLAVSNEGNRTIAMRYLPSDTGVTHAISGKTRL